MKTKKTTKGRKALREVDVALQDCADEFGEIIGSDFLDEDAYLLDDEEEL